MSLIKSPKLWSWLALIASTLCLIAAIYALLGFRMESIDYRGVTSLLRSVVQVGLLAVLPFTLIVLFISRANRTALVRSATATLIVLMPLVGIIGNQPAGTTLFETPRPAASTQSGNGEMAMGGGGSSAPAKTPPLNDISTDTLDPPLYSAVIALRPEGSNTLEYPKTAPTTQKQLFPDIAPIHTDLAPVSALKRAAEVADDMGWKLVSQNAENGSIEAVATTFFLGFKDDVVIRVRENGNGSIVDIRSHSRQGRGDRGVNAARVRQFIAQF